MSNPASLLSVLGGPLQANVLTDDGNVMSVRGVPPSVVTSGGLLLPASPQGALFIDPQNVSGNAGVGTGFGTSAGSPLSSYRALVQQWGTNAPLLNTPTTITWLSSATDSSDPVICYPIVQGTTNPFAIQGTTPTLVANIALSGVVPKSRAAGSNSLLQANLGGSAAQGLLLENLTHPSRAWVYTNVSGTTWNISQPLVKAVVGGTPVPAEVDTWANGDSVNLLQPTAVNVVAVQPTYTDFLDAGNNNEGYLYQLICFAPSTAAAMYLGDIRVHECRTDRILQARGGASLRRGLWLSNVDAKNSYLVGSGTLVMLAGIERGTFSVNTFGGGSVPSVDFDHIIGANAIWQVPAVSVGTVFLDGNVTVPSGRIAIALGLSGTAAVYGSAGHNFLMQGNSRVSQTFGTFVNTLTAPALISPGISLNGASVASSLVPGTPDVLNGNIATTPANLDAAASTTGFGGTAFVLGGASVSNLA